MERCGICHSEIYQHQISVLCPADQTPYHQDCWNFNQGCGVLGCRHNPHSTGSTRVSPQVVVKVKQIIAWNNPSTSKTMVYQGTCRNHSTGHNGNIKIILTWKGALLSGHLAFSGELHGNGDFSAQESGNTISFGFIDKKDGYAYKFEFERLSNDTIVGNYVASKGNAKYNGTFSAKIT